MSISFDFSTYFELEIEIDVSSYTPYRPPPPCSNPDSPMYSDCGDDEEMEWMAYFIVEEKGTKKKKRIPVPEEVIRLMQDRIEDDIRDEAEGQWE